MKKQTISFHIISVLNENTEERERGIALHCIGVHCMQEWGRDFYWKFEYLLLKASMTAWGIMSDLGI